MAERFFTPQAVDPLIPLLTELMGGVMEAHTELTRLEERWAAERERLALSGGGWVNRAAWERERARHAALAERIRSGLARIVALGGVPKDLRLGLVDFPARRGGEVVNLCWRYGERQIRYWHGLEEGYAGRKPL
jgi:hypothetical protein